MEGPTIVFWGFWTIVLLGSLFFPIRKWYIRYNIKKNKGYQLLVKWDPEKEANDYIVENMYKSSIYLEPSYVLITSSLELALERLEEGRLQWKKDNAKPKIMKV